MSEPLDRVRDRFSEIEDVEADGPPAAAGGADGGGAPPEGPPDGGSPSPAAEAARFPLNDIGNGRRFALYFGRDVMRVSRVGWFVWSGARWEQDQEDWRTFSPRVRAMAHEVGARIVEEIPHLALEDWQRRLIASEPGVRAEHVRLLDIAEAERTEPQVVELAEAKRKLAEIEKTKGRLTDMRAEHRRFARSSGNSGRIEAMLTEAAVTLGREFDALDADPLVVNTRGGSLRFSVDRPEGCSATAAVEIGPHRRDDLLSKMMPVDYDPDAAAPGFEAFLERIQPAAEMRRFLQRWFGLSMTGLTGEQKMVFFYGHGANGKSVLVDLMARMLGDYAATAKIESLTGQSKRGGSDATPDLIPLMGARMVRASEPEQGERLKESTIKELTGGEPIMVRALHSDFVEVQPKFKLTMSGNHKPEIRGTDDGIWRRVLLTPFDVQIPLEQRDPEMIEKLWAEAPGILNWMVDGLLQCLEGGLQIPDAVLAATGEYREESDPVGAFLTECAVVTGQETDFTPSKDLIEAFNFWLEEKGETRWAGRTVSLRLKDKAGRWRHPASGRAFTPGKSGTTGYRGVRLTETFDARFRLRQDQSAGPDQGAHHDLF